MNLQENVKLSGVLKIWKQFPDGTLEKIYEEDNLITLAAKQYLLSAIYSAGIPSDQVTNLKVGTGGTIDPEGQFPKLENPLWTDLNTPLLSVSTSYVLNSAIPSVTFLADLDAATGNGSLITEAGLFKASSLIFNVKTFPGIPKTSEFNLHFEWTIKMA